jgi:hypothetical protein
MKVRPKFLRWVGILFVCGLLIDAFAYFNPPFSLPKRPSMNCPLLAQFMPLSKAPVQATDSLELVTYIGKPGIPYTVRIYGDGRVERDTVISLLPTFHIGCPLHEPDKFLRIPAAQATAIIAKARDGGFCRLCEGYQSTHPAATDSFDLLTLTFQGKTNRVANSSGHPPPLFNELVSSLNGLSSIPDYAKSDGSSPQRQVECSEFLHSQIDNLQNHLDKH